jgi:hypothetical protein
MAFDEKKHLMERLRAATAIYMAALNDYRHNKDEKQEPTFKARLDSARNQCDIARKELADHTREHGA